MDAIVKSKQLTQVQMKYEGVVETLFNYYSNPIEVTNEIQAAINIKPNRMGIQAALDQQQLSK